MKTPIPFSKLHGLGNDYLFLDAIAHPFLRNLDLTELSALAIAMSHRRNGPGADGIVLVLPAENAVAAMRIFNSDGSEAENCGNALRCIARLCRERGYTQSATFVIETAAGPVDVFLDPDDTSYSKVRITLGKVSWEPSTIPMHGKIDTHNIIINAGDQSFNAACLSIGNPHCVIFSTDFTIADVQTYGPLIEHHPMFPGRINVGFCSVTEINRLRLAVWERGAGMTGACGTGAAAAFAAARDRDLIDPDCIVSMPGGSLGFHQDPSGTIHMTGPASHVYDGVFFNQP